MLIHCRGFRNPLTGKFQVAVNHSAYREVKPQDKHQVRLCVNCQRAKEWYRWQSNLKKIGQPYKREFDGKLIIPKEKVK